MATAGVAVLVLAVPAAASVSEQRARLSAPAECGDPITGLWKSHSYDPSDGQWAQFSLRVQRAPGSETQLVGEIENHSWYGDDTREQPGLCSGQLRFRVSMKAEGTLVGDDLEFWGMDEWALDEVICGNWGTMGYNLDHFSGTVDHEIHEFQSVNNDGGRAVNEPTVFRRVRCDSDAEAKVDPIVEAPPFQPPRTGCLW